MDKKGYSLITTEILEGQQFYYAEEHHQQYLQKVPKGYCGLKGTGVSCPIGAGKDELWEICSEKEKDEMIYEGHYVMIYRTWAFIFKTIWYADWICAFPVYVLIFFNIVTY